MSKSKERRRHSPRGAENLRAFRTGLTLLFPLTLHHIPSLPAILATMFQCLKPGGWIALTDFEDFGPDAVIFHPKSKREGVERHGIKRNGMEVMINGTGFDQVKVETAFTLLRG
jgi:SAM-dependent methyltransferase